MHNRALTRAPKVADALDPLGLLPGLLEGIFFLGAGRSTRLDRRPLSPQPLVFRAQLGQFLHLPAHLGVLGLEPLQPPTSTLHPFGVPISPRSLTADSAQELMHPETPILNLEGNGIP
jgi:hypothetical protein